jgi:cellulose synthase/poly-beta-1,6-N-acetylglucosamine synthase-like glycosyltransferase
MSLPKFSVITVSFNHGEFIRQTIESVIAQQYPNFEHIVIDGGSTDDTISILKEYPHIKWVSEPDRGQSDALNKGFAQATGDVIAWINSDDWYAPNAFHTVAQHIDKHPIVMGATCVTDRTGTPTETVENVERTWFDAMKYWVFNSVPAQPGIFFKRSILEELGIESGECFDEGLFFTMDYDLWLRMLERYPFSCRIPQTLAYLRNYETNKTGADMAGAYREMSRVYRRHSSRRIHPEQNLSFVVPMTQPDERLHHFAVSVAQQNLPCLEIVVVDHSGSRQAGNLIRKQVNEIGSRLTKVAFQVVLCAEDAPLTRTSAFDTGVRSAKSHVVACVDTCNALPKEFALNAVTSFSRDDLGLLFPNLVDDVKERLFSPVNGGLMFNPAGPFNVSLADVDFVVRKLAWLDCGGLAVREALMESDFSVKRLLVMMAHKAWRLTSENLLPCSPSRPQQRDEEPFRLYVNSSVVDEIALELRRSPFSVFRAKNGFGLVLPDELWMAAQRVLEGFPATLFHHKANCSLEGLRQLVEQYPNFGPAHYLLAQALENDGKSVEARAELARWSEIRTVESTSPLFGAATRPD